jgi:hypothetical protein
MLFVQPLLKSSCAGQLNDLRIYQGGCCVCINVQWPVLCCVRYGGCDYALALLQVDQFLWVICGWCFLPCVLSSFCHFGLRDMKITVLKEQRREQLREGHENKPIFKSIIISCIIFSFFSCIIIFSLK